MTESELKFREIENIYGEVVDRLDATTKYFNDYKNSIASERNYQHPGQLLFLVQKLRYIKSLKLLPR